MGTAAYLADLPGVPAIFEEVELGVFQAKVRAASTWAGRLRHRLTLVKLNHYLRQLVPRFSTCTVVSSVEAALLRNAVPAYSSICMIPNGVDAAGCGDVLRRPEPNTLIFAGSFRYFANHDAMEWFVRDVFPLIQARVPDVTLTITGDHADLPLPEARNVRRTGFVDDVRPLVASSWASLAPIRLGWGTRLKILESMALRTPVISTTKGAEGLEARHGEHRLIADRPRHYADEVVRLLVEPGPRDRLARNAYHVVHDKYDWRSTLPGFLRLVNVCAVSAV